MKWIKIISIIVVIIYGIFSLTPVYITVISSFKDLNEVFTIPPRLIPFEEFQPTLEAYNKIFETDIGRTFLTSLIVATSATAISIAASIISAYGFSRFPGAPMNDDRSFFTLLTLRMVPPFAVVFPILVYWVTLNLADTYISLIWTYTVFSIPLAIWLLKGFFDEIPRNVEDAARIDGYSFSSIFRRFILPLLGAGLAATVALVWLFLWNEFLFAVKIAGGNVLTYTAKLPQLRHAERLLWNVYAAMGTLAIIPPILILLIFRRYITRLYLSR
jgi:multiple sugar transport system permease protein